MPGYRFDPQDPAFASRVRASYARQAAMKTIGAELVSIEPGSAIIELPWAEPLTQQPRQHAAQRRGSGLRRHLQGRGGADRGGDPVGALVLVAGDLPLDDWRELASDEVTALNLHGPIHFARAYLPARHDGAPAWRMVLVRSQGA